MEGAGTLLYACTARRSDGSTSSWFSRNALNATKPAGICHGDSDKGEGFDSGTKIKATGPRESDTLSCLLRAVCSHPLWSQRDLRSQLVTNYASCIPTKVHGFRGIGFLTTFYVGCCPPPHTHTQCTDKLVAPKLVHHGNSNLFRGLSSDAKTGKL